MFDLSSFLSGLIGAVVGGGVTLLVAWQGVKDVRQERIRDHVNAMMDEFRALAKARNSDEQPVSGAWEGPVGEQIEQTNRSISRLALVLKKRENAILQWATMLVVDVWEEDDNHNRRGIVLTASADIALWMQGRRSLEWFQTAADASEERHASQFGRIAKTE